MLFPLIFCANSHIAEHFYDAVWMDSNGDEMNTDLIAVIGGIHWYTLYDMVIETQNPW